MNLEGRRGMEGGNWGAIGAPPERGSLLHSMLVAGIYRRVCTKCKLLTNYGIYISNYQKKRQAGDTM